MVDESLALMFVALFVVMIVALFVEKSYCSTVPSCTRIWVVVTGVFFFPLSLSLSPGTFVAGVECSLQYTFVAFEYLMGL
jgi:hypothetical protein